jgi:flavin prenyltransferase
MKIILAISGSSGSIYARVLLDQLILKPQIEVALLVSQNALVNWELENPDHSLNSYPYRNFAPDDFNAPFASGSSKWDAMIVCPCSAGFMARVASGFSNDLMSRSADVMLKERRKLILVLRETPLSLIHIENMRKITLSGGIICPAIPSFYSKPNSIEAIAETVTNRILDLCTIDHSGYRWKDIAKN